MVVDRRGRAYIGNFGFDFAAGAPASPAEIVLVTPDGRARRVGEGLLFPNGTVITPNGQTLIFVCTAESAVPGRGRRQVGGRIEIVEVEVPGDGLP